MIVAVACIAIITAVIDVKIKGILHDDDIEDKQILITNGITIIAVNIAVNGSGLKSKCCPFENGSENIRISPTATIRKTPHDITRYDLEAKDKESIL
jgi:hypothetical protein